MNTNRMVQTFKKLSRINKNKRLIKIMKVLVYWYKGLGKVKK